MSQSTRNALKRIEMRNKIFTPLTHLCAERRCATTKIFEKQKECVFIDSNMSRNALKRIEMQKKNYLNDRLHAERRSTNTKRLRATLPTPCHPKVISSSHPF